MVGRLLLTVEGSVGSHPEVPGVETRTGTWEGFGAGLASATGNDWHGYVRTDDLMAESLANLVSAPDAATTAGVLIPLAAPEGIPNLWREVPSSVTVLVPQPQFTAAVCVRPSDGSSVELAPAVIAAGLAQRTWSVAEATGPRMVILDSDCSPLTPRRPTLDAPLREAIRSEVQRQRSALGQVQATALHAGLLLLHDDLDGSHSLSQTIEGEEGHYGDYWHAIMHRREPDYGNAKYWFRRVGRHSTMRSLAKALQAGAFGPIPEPWDSRLSGSGGWDSMAFVDLCEAATRNPALEAVARRIQRIEMLTLLSSLFDASAG